MALRTRKIVWIVEHERIFLLSIFLFVDDRAILKKKKKRDRKKNRDKYFLLGKGEQRKGSLLSRWECIDYIIKKELIHSIPWSVFPKFTIFEMHSFPVKRFLFVFRMTSFRRLHIQASQTSSDSV